MPPTSRAGRLAPILQLADTALLFGSLWAAWRTWLWWRPQLRTIVQVPYRDLLLFNEWMPSAVVMVLVWVLVLRHLGFYDPARTFSAVRAAGVLSKAALYVLLLVVLVEFFAPQRYYSRSLVGLFVGYGFLATGLTRWAFLKAQEHLDMPITAHEVAVVGLGEQARLMEERLARQGRAVWHLAGFVAPAGEVGEPEVDPSKVLGGVEDLRRIVNEHGVEAVILAARVLDRKEALELTTRCDQMGLRVLQVPFTWGIVSPRLRTAELGDLQLVDLATLSYPSLGQHFKRAFDIVSVLLASVVLLPAMLAASIAIRLESPGSVLYVSPRVGRGGRAFPFYKFRSMVAGADRRRGELQSRNEADGPLFKIRDDPRITRVGRLIRRLSVDELPQFWNVLRGDMNLVGPRPLPLDDLAGIEDDPEIAYWFELRHKVPPGITGLWQVMGRSDLGFKEMVQLDIYYIQNWSPWMDLKILLLTVPAVLRSRGAA